MTWDVNGLGSRGGFAPGSNATLVGNPLGNFSCPITNSSANHSEGFYVEFNCRQQDLAFAFRYNRTGNCSTMVFDGRKEIVLAHADYCTILYVRDASDQTPPVSLSMAQTGGPGWGQKDFQPSY